jgi:hypothetical protein
LTVYPYHAIIKVPEGKGRRKTTYFKKDEVRKMFDYEVWYEGNCIVGGDGYGFEDEYEVIADAWATVKSKMEEWEYDCELEIFLIKLKCDGNLIDEIDGVELKASL